MTVAVKIFFLVVLIAACLAFSIPVLYFEIKAVRALYEHHREMRHQPRIGPVVPWSSSLKIVGGILGVCLAIVGGWLLLTQA